MIAVVRQFPVRSALIAITLVALFVVMWNAWAFGTGLAFLFIYQPVELARLMGLGPANDPSPRNDRKKH